jgi:hypothetical protein
MLGICRAKATLGLQILEVEHMIRKTHDPIQVLDRLSWKNVPDDECRRIVEARTKAA